MRLGYLVPQFPAQTHIFYWRELTALRDLGVDPVLLSTRAPPAGLVAHSWSQEAAAQTHYLVQPDPLAALRALKQLGLAELRHAAQGEPKSFQKDLLLSLGAAWRLRSLARDKGFSHVHVHSCARAALIATLAFRMGGPSYSMTLHNPLHVYGAGQAYKWRHATFASVVSTPLMQEVQDKLAAVLPPTVDIQPMGVDTDRFHRPAPWQAPDPKGPIRLFSCGRLAPVKGHLDLLQSLRILLGKGYDLHLTIAGEDDLGGHGYRSTIEGDIHRHGLQDRVRLLGAVDESVIRNHLINSDYFALSSLDEGVPVALMEAMACGLPTIGTHVGGVADLVKSGCNGILIPPQSPEILATTLEGLFHDPDRARALATAGRQSVVEGFGAHRSAQRLQALLASAPVLP